MHQGPADRASRASYPERVGRYEILVPIASGGMGVVFLGRSRGAGGFEREVALKLLHPLAERRDSLAHELIEEAKLTARIRHPNVVQVFDVDHDEIGVFMAMEYVEGCSLSDLIEAAGTAGRHLPQEVGLRILLDALSGLHAAHELTGPDGRALGLVHRDFSPHNILVGVDGISKLADFGIAKAETRASRTATGAIKGKLCYLAPEQIKGLALDRRCDVWAAGVVAWEVLAGQRLYASADDVAIMYRILEDAAPRLRSVAADVPVGLDEAVARALAKAPAGRFASAAAMARAIEASGVDVASAEEVAAHVRRVAGDDLAARRMRAAEAVRARATPAATDPSNASRDAPAVTAPMRQTGSFWRRRRGASKVGLVALLAAGLGGAVALAVGPRLRAADLVEPAANEPAGAPDGQGARVATAGVAAPAEAPLASSSRAAPEPPPAEPPTAEAPAAAASSAGAVGARAASSASAPRATSGKARPVKQPLPLADSPYQRKP